MPNRLRASLVLALLLACNNDTMTTATDGGTGTGGSAGSTGDTTPTSSASTSGATGSGGTDGGSESASGGQTTTTGLTDGGSASTTEGGGTGGSGSGMACVKWYTAIYDSFTAQCECEVKQGNYRTVEQCLMDLAPPSDCACSIFAQDPQTVQLLNCYEKAAQDKTTCLDGADLCIDTLPLDTCNAAETAALLQCGAPSPGLCMSLKSMCDGLVPPICPL